MENSISDWRLVAIARPECRYSRPGDLPAPQAPAPRGLRARTLARVQVRRWPALGSAGKPPVLPRVRRELSEQLAAGAWTVLLPAPLLRLQRLYFSLQLPLLV